jgi:ArpU family phage transcriptional regulator
MNNTETTYIDEDSSIDTNVIKRVERDLKNYPDWIVRLEAGGLGIKSNAIVVSGGSNYNTSSLVEQDFELSEETKRKIITIEKVYDRLHGKTKDLVDYRYFQDYDRFEVLEMLQISKRKYYNLRDRALESFARAFGYIE